MTVHRRGRVRYALDVVLAMAVPAGGGFAATMGAGLAVNAVGISGRRGVAGTGPGFLVTSRRAGNFFLDRLMGLS
jgi:hypothetical protein